MGIVNSDVRLTGAPPGAVRPAAVSGRFYPGNRRDLAALVARLLAGVAPEGTPRSAPKALIVPHAGYVYSGPIAASAYATLAGARNRIRRVLLIGPAHRVWFHGLALPAATHFQTPLGTVPVDVEGARRLLALPGVQVNEAAHAQEHSLEVQLPFLQYLFEDFTLLPLVAGDADPQTVAAVLEAAWDDDETLVLISSDLSHYHDYQTARRIDAESSRAIERLDLAPLGPEQACGCVPVRGLLHLARRRGLQVRCIDLRNSGDTAGPRDRVVGYGAYRVDAPADVGHGSTLLSVARGSIERGLEGGRLIVNAHDFPRVLREPRGAFVTLTLGGRLRGCMGTTEAEGALIVCVARCAFNAAFRDPRFPRLTHEEYGRTTLSVSVLGRPAPIAFEEEEQLLAALRPGVDGLIIESEGRRATFLPSVWESLPDPADFLGQLKAKAGIAAAEGPQRAWRYGAEYFSEA